MDLLDRFVNSDRALKRWAVASLLANMGIILTGALVRLTKSGLGCSTWPQCSGTSYVPVPESGIHGIIEFGNRMLTFVLVAISIGMALAAYRAWRSGRAPRRLFTWSVAVGLGIIAQAVIGGISVLTALNPWAVGLHMVASVALIMICVELVHLAYALAPAAAPGRLSWLTQVVGWLGLVVIGLGVVVTGAGPNSGDGAAQRNGLDLEATAKLHAWAVWALVALTVLGLLWSAADARLRRLWLGLLAVEVLQGAIGYWQYFTHLPLALVLGHMLGTTLFTAALTHLWRLTARTSSA